MPFEPGSIEELQSEIKALRKRVSELENSGSGLTGNFAASQDYQNMRVLDRKPLFLEVPVHALNKPSNKGTVLNMTVRGLGVKGIHCSPQENIELHICPPGNMGLENFSFEAVCRWTHQEQKDGIQYSGFEITKISPTDLSNLSAFLMTLGYEYLRDQFRRRKGEEALKVIESSSDLIFRISQSGIITFVNRAFCRFSALSRTSLLGLDFEIFLPETTKTEFKEFLKSNCNEDFHGSYECPVIGASGVARFYQWTADARFDQSSQAMEFQFVGRDITDTRKKELDLLDSHVKLEQKVEDHSIELDKANLKLNQEIERRRRIEEALDKKLWALTRPDSDIGDFNLTDLIDINTLQKIQESFSDFVEIPIELIGMNGKSILASRKISYFQAKIVSTEDGRHMMEEQNSLLISRAGSDAVFCDQNFLLSGVSIYLCPISIQGRSVGAWKIGPGFDTEPCPEEVKRLAQRVGLDEAELYVSINSDVFGSKDKLLKAALFLSHLSTQVSMLGLQNLSQARIIHELNQAQREIQRSEQKMRNLLEYAPVGIFLSTKGMVSFANHAMCKMYGLTSPHEMEGLSVDTLFNGGLPDPNPQSLFESIGCDLRAVTKNGQDFDVTLYFNSMIFDRESSLIGFVIDKSQENALRNQLLHAQKMEALGTFATGIAHDFNNILTIIMGYTQIALTGVDSREVINDQLNQILAASKRARDLVSQILTFCRKDTHEKKPLNIIPIIKETIKFLDASFPSTIKIKSDIRSDDHLILGDPSQIHQVLMNLCSNAGYSMGKQGGILDINLEVSDEEQLKNRGIILPKSGLSLKLTVKDSGPGVDPKIGDRIFEPYFTTKPVGEGSGMGLAVAHGIVTGHSGLIRLDQSCKQGACFEVYLPIIDRSSNVDEQEDETDLSGNGNIMFVDEEKALSDIAREMLQNFGYKAYCFVNPVVALNMFRIGSYDFDLVITDLTMNELSGLTLAQEIKKIRPEIPVLLMTGYDANNEITAKEMETINAVIQKPFTDKKLGSAIKRALYEANLKTD